MSCLLVLWKYHTCRRPSIQNPGVYAFLKPWWHWTNLCYQVIRMCHGENRLKAGGGHGSATIGLKCKPSPYLYSAKTPPPTLCASHRYRLVFSIFLSIFGLNGWHVFAITILIIHLVFHHSFGNDLLGLSDLRTGNSAQTELGRFSDYRICCLGELLDSFFIFFLSDYGDKVQCAGL